MNRAVVTSDSGYSTLDDLVFVLNEFNQHLPRPGIAPLALSVPVPLQTELSWPNASDAGVYVLYTPEERLVYIGKASFNSTIGIRLHSHLQRVKNPNCEPQWSGAFYTRAIPVPRTHAFEAGAIEEYLLGRLRTTANVISGSRPPDEA